MRNISKNKKITIDKSPMMMYTKNTKRQDLKRLRHQRYFLDSPDLDGGGYLTFTVSVIKNTITKTIILVMYFIATTTSNPD